MLSTLLHFNWLLREHSAVVFPTETGILRASQMEDFVLKGPLSVSPQHPHSHSSVQGELRDFTVY